MVKASKNSHTLTTEGLGTEPVSTMEELHRVLTNLFSEEGRARAQALRHALCGQGELDPILAELNHVDGKPRPFKLNETQHAALKELLTSSQYAVIAPAEPTTVSSHAASKFWRELLSMTPGEVKDFHHRVVDYSNDRNNTAKRESVLALLRKYVPEGNWDQTHVDALVAMNAQGIQFKSLAWFPYIGDIW
ncbi:hypothetical protein KYC5002_30360 [Archangium violaceum]|uniref:hypothetical protein n=1 Tax=Archangium violaceum TaxID=83451 RepID=UPI002B309D23|nr:hypothetical protein KYC5002_30360 [Archangium gephyra]